MEGCLLYAINIFHISEKVQTMVRNLWLENVNTVAHTFMVYCNFHNFSFPLRDFEHP